MIAAEISRCAYPDVNAASREFPSLGTGSRLCSCSHWSPRLDSRVSVATIIGSREPRATRMQLHSLHSSVKRRTHPCRVFMTLICWIDVKVRIPLFLNDSQSIRNKERIYFLGTIRKILLLGIKLDSRYRVMSIILLLYSRR